MCREKSICSNYIEILKSRKIDPQKMDQFSGIFVMATKKWNIIICEHFTTVDPQIKILHVFTIFVKILDRKDLYAIIMHVVLKTTCKAY